MIEEQFTSKFVRRTNRCKGRLHDPNDALGDHDQADIDQQERTRLGSHLIADATRVQRGFHVVAVRMRSHELESDARFCAISPPPPPPQAHLLKYLKNALSRRLETFWHELIFKTKNYFSIASARPWLP